VYASLQQQRRWRKGERKEYQPKIGALCHRATNGDSVCGRYNSPRRASVEGANCIGRVHHVGEEEWNALEIRNAVCDAAAVGLPISRWFSTRGRETTVSKQSKNLGMVLDANGASAESLRGRVRPATGRLMERRGTATRHAANRGGTFLRYIRIVNVATQRVSETDITCRYDDDQRIGAAICDSSTGKKFSYTEGIMNMKILQYLLRLYSPMLYKNIQANRLVRAFLNVTVGDESEVVRDWAQRTPDNARHMPCLQATATSFTDPVTDAKLQTSRLSD
jgi:hypothetical protein